MEHPQQKKADGFALLIFLIVLLGIAGIALTGFSQNALKSVEKSRFEHNKEVLLKAKQALLMYAFNYPAVSLAAGGVARGPGRLPCPDTDNDGQPEPSFFCIAGVGLVGRFPWDDPDFRYYDARDASGERLWYSVSRNFANTGPAVVNSDSAGTISIFDQSRNLLYNGAVNGVAAVIIAPGSAINNQDRSILNADNPSDTTPDTDPGIVNPANYLDSFNTFDNSSFLNGGNNDADGFILGPVTDQSIEVINDQIIIITADEVIAMAEKATLQVYQDAINEYQTDIGIERYPWLDPYESSDGLATFDAVSTPAAPIPVIGRAPSIFANYFVGPGINTVDSQPIKPEVRLTITIEDEIHHMTLPAPGAANTFFRGADGDLVSQINNGDTYTRFFWDGHPLTPSHPRDFVWEMCPDVLGTEDDCNQDAAGNFIHGPSSAVILRTREIDITFNGGTPIEFAFGDRTAAPIEYWRDRQGDPVPGLPSPENPDPSNHVYIAAEYDDAPGYISNFYYEQDDFFQADHVPSSNATLIFGSGGTDSLKVGLPYYPVLPAWVLDNNWHDRMQVAYSSAVEPGGDGTCDVGADDCLTLLSSGGIINDKLALLIQSGADIDGDLDIGLVDGGGIPQYYADDLGDIFEGENNTSPQVGALADQLTFDRRPTNGNDIVLVVQ